MMIPKFLYDFGFDETQRKPTEVLEMKLEPKKPIVLGPKPAKTKSRNEMIWTVFVYVFLSSGIFLRTAVNFPNAQQGLNIAVFTPFIILASLIIGLAILSPLLKVISLYHKGRLSWHHCLTAFSIGFFGDMTFQVLLNTFVGIIK